MNNLTLKRNLYLLKFQVILFLLTSALPVYSISKVNETDSLKLLVQHCSTDTCRFRVFSDYFWLYANYDIKRVKEIGILAFNEIKNSRNLRSLADGYDIKGVMLESEKKYDSAKFYFNKALKTSEQAAYNSRIGWSYYHLGTIYARQGNMDSARYLMNKLLSFYSNKSMLSEACNVYRQIGTLYAEQSEPDSAITNYYKMLALSHRIGDKQQEMAAYIAIMYFYNKTNNVKKLIETINEGLILAQEINHQKALINIYYLIGEVFLNQKKNYEIALIYYKKVLDICASKNREWEATILNDIGDLYLQQGNVNMALFYVQKGLSLARQLNFKHQISESYRNLGKIYLHQGNLTSAVNSFKTCYNTGCDKCSKIVFHNALIDIADSYMSLHDEGNAIDYYQKSLALAKEFNSDKELAISKFKIGNFYQHSKYALARKYYLAAIESAIKSNDLKTIKDISDTLSSFLSLSGDFKSAYKYQLLARSTEDSINMIAQQASLAELELKFLFEKINKENEIKAQESVSEIRRQKLMRNAFLSISLLLIIMGVIIYISYRRNKRDSVLLGRMSAELHQADEMKLRFFANVSHEFRTPLTLIMNPARKLLEHFREDNEHKKQLEYIYSNAIKLNELTNQIMDLQKLDAGKLILKPEFANIVSYCVGIVSSFESICYKKKNIIRLVSNCRSAGAFFDKDKIGKIISNLLSNAFKFCFHETVIEVRILLTDQYFAFTVIDKGIGIPSDEINKAFNQYYQATSNLNGEGTGIGLAYVKELVEFMQGSIKAESVINQGTEITIGFPITGCQITDEAEMIIEIPQTKTIYSRTFVLPEPPDENKYTILLTEDNNELRNFIAELFKPEYNIIMSVDGKEGLESAFRYIPDLIISDIMMPNLNGFEMCGILKKDERTSHIPVLLLTAKDNQESSIEGYQTGADDYILKPFDNELLRLKVKNVLATRASIRNQFNSESNTLPNAGAYSEIDRNFMKKCIHVINQNKSNPEFSVEKLARELAFSRSNLYRKVQSLTNFNPAELIRNIRLQHACYLLKNTNLRVYEVATEAGYDNTNKFSQAFKKQFGLLPSEVHIKPGVRLTQP
jgi:signal transduction histidine kinase/DNA-binding response OmpR family regulator